MTRTKNRMADLRRAVKRAGGSVSGGLFGRQWSYNLHAPDEHIWDATGDTSTLVVTWRDGDDKDCEDAIQDAMERVALGVTPCQSDEVSQ